MIVVRLFAFLSLAVFFRVCSESEAMFDAIEVVSHIDRSCAREVTEYGRISALPGGQLVQEFQDKCVIFSKTAADFQYPKNERAVAVFDHAMANLVNNPVGKELIAVLFTKLMRKRAVWSAIASKTGLQKERIVEAVNGYKSVRDVASMTVLKGALSSTCDLIRCVLSPGNPDDVGDNRVVSAASINFCDFYDDATGRVKVDVVGGRLRSVYSTSKNSNVNGEKVETEIAVVPHSAAVTQFFGLFQDSKSVSQVVRVVLGVVDVFLDVSYRAMEYDSTLEIMNFHKCCFSSATDERSSVCLNFADYDPTTLTSSGTYSMIGAGFQDLSDLFSFERVMLASVNKSLVDAIFHECVHFLHVVEGKRLVGTIGVEILFGVRDIRGVCVPALIDILQRKGMVKRWTKDEELVTILGIKFEGSKPFFDRLSNAGFMYNRLYLVRIWHMVVASPSFISDVEEDRMKEVLDVIGSKV